MLISSFLNYIRFEKRYSVHTVTSYENDLKQFVDFLSTTYDTDDICSVESFHVRSYIVHLMDRGIKASSIRRKLSGLNSFYKYLMRTSKVSKSPVKGVITPKLDKLLPSFVAEKQIRTLMEDRSANPGFEEIRNNLIVELLYSTGMRRAELIGLKDSSINLNKKEIKVLGKRNKERIIPVHDSVIPLIRSYISIRDDSIEMLDNFLFVTSKGNKLYPKLVYLIVNKALEQITTLSKRSPHVLRHTFATHLLNKGADINAIKELLGHSNLASTQVYTHNTIEKLKQVHKMAHPKS